MHSEGTLQLYVLLFTEKVLYKKYWNLKGNKILWRKTDLCFFKIPKAFKPNKQFSCQVFLLLVSHPIFSYNICRKHLRNPL